MEKAQESTNIENQQENIINISNPPELEVNQESLPSNPKTENTETKPGINYSGPSLIDINPKPERVRQIKKLPDNLTKKIEDMVKPIAVNPPGNNTNRHESSVEKPQSKNRIIIRNQSKDKQPLGSNPEKTKMLDLRGNDDLDVDNYKLNEAFFQKLDMLGINEGKSSNIKLLCLEEMEEIMEICFIQRTKISKILKNIDQFYNLAKESIGFVKKNEKNNSQEPFREKQMIINIERYFSQINKLIIDENYEVEIQLKDKLQQEFKSNASLANPSLGSNNKDKKYFYKPKTNNKMPTIGNNNGSGEYGFSDFSTHKKLETILPQTNIFKQIEHQPKMNLQIGSQNIQKNNQFPTVIAANNHLSTKPNVNSLSLSSTGGSNFPGIQKSIGYNERSNSPSKNHDILSQTSKQQYPKTDIISNSISNNNLGNGGADSRYRVNTEPNRGMADQTLKLLNIGNSVVNNTYHINKMTPRNLPGNEYSNNDISNTKGFALKPSINLNMKNSPFQGKLESIGSNSNLAMMDNGNKDVRPGFGGKRPSGAYRRDITDKNKMFENIVIGNPKEGLQACTGLIRDSLESGANIMIGNSNSVPTRKYVE